MAGITDIEAGNAFLPGFVERFNARFALAPARPDDLQSHRIGCAKCCAGANSAMSGSS